MDSCVGSETLDLAASSKSSLVLEPIPSSLPMLMPSKAHSHENSIASASLPLPSSVVCGSPKRTSTSPSPLIPKAMIMPFTHQVSGHGALLKSTDGCILKPLIPRELHFYTIVQSKTPDFLPFIPAFRGAVELSDDIVQQSEPSEISASESSPRHHAKEPYDNVETSAKWQEILKKPKPYSAAKLPVDSLSPWALQMHENLVGQLSSGSVHRYVMLEDLTRKYSKPTIIDLKMGTRQHGLDAPPEKAARQLRKVAGTTSAKLGVRFCGGQLYRIDQAGYIHKDKYYGRKLSVEEMHETMREFFHNGVRLRTDVIRFFVQRLKVLLEVFERQRHFVFYSSSLLLIYEGEHEGDAKADAVCSHADVRMVDFAHTYETTDNPPDPGYFLGIQSTITMLQSILDNSEKERTFSI